MTESKRRAAMVVDQRLIEPPHTTVHTEPRPEAYDKLRYMQVKRVFHTPPEVMGMVIQSGHSALERMLKHPVKTLFMSMEAGFLLSFGVLMSVQVGGRWGSGSVGVNNFVFAGFGIPFGLTFIVFMQGSELMTANYMYTTFAVLAAAPGERRRLCKGLLGNWVLCWLGNCAGAVLHVVLFAWQSGLLHTVKLEGNGLPASSYSDPLDTLEHSETVYYASRREFREDFWNGDLCTRDDYLYANTCTVMKLADKKTTANFATTILRGWGCNWMVCLAMWLQSTATEPVSKLFMIWLPVTLFVSCGFDHFVVNMWLLPAAILSGGTYLDPRLNWGNALWFNLLPATIGAILGAWCLVLHIWFLYSDYWHIAQDKKALYAPLVAPCTPAGLPEPPSWTPSRDDADDTATTNDDDNGGDKSAP